MPTALLSAERTDVQVTQDSGASLRVERVMELLSVDLELTEAPAIERYRSFNASYQDVPAVPDYGTGLPGDRYPI
jgi:hypothetical protein